MYSKLRRIFSGFFIFLSAVLFASTPGFLQNRGQVIDQNGRPNNDVLFYYSSPAGFKINLRKTGYSYEITSRKNRYSSSIRPRTHQACSDFVPDTVCVSRVDIDFQSEGAIPVIETQHSGAYYNFILGDKEIINVFEWQKVIYKNVFTGIDIEFILTADEKDNFKYNIIVHPGADIHAIRFLVKGCEAKQSVGLLLYSTPMGEISERIPRSFYSDSPAEVQGIAFNLDGNQITFKGQYDSKKTLVIDPVPTLQWATYIGGTQTDISVAVGSDAAGSIYLGGYTSSAANIATTGTYQFTLAGSFDTFISRFDKSGARIWTSYYGGPAVDIAYAMSVHQDGVIYLTGGTSSTIGVASPGAHQVTYGGGINDIFLVKFDNTGQRLWSTYYGGEAHDITQAITLDKNGNVLLTGHTESTLNIATPGAYKTVYNFNFDVCLAKFSPAGTLLWGTYFGDSGIDEAYGMVTDTLGNVYITGATSSISDIATNGCHQLLPGGALDAFIAKINSAGNAVLWGTYYGGQSTDFGTAMEVNKAGTLFIGGTTTSSTDISTPGSYQPAKVSFDESFLTAFTPTGTRVWGTYFGGDDVDYIMDIVATEQSAILICGATTSSTSIGTAGVYQPTIALPGFYDAYFAKFSVAGMKEYATYYGGTGNETAWGIALDKIGRVYLAGEATSTTAIATTGAFQTSYSGNTDGFLAKFCIPFVPKLSPAKAAAICKGTISVSTTPGFSSYLWSNGVTNNPMLANIYAPGDYFFSVSVNDGVDCVGKSDTVKITILSCVGLDERSNSASVTVYPSPASERLFIQEEADYTAVESRYEIYSAAGQLVHIGELAAGYQNKSADISRLPSGLYILRLHIDGTSVEKKFFKE